MKKFLSIFAIILFVFAFSATITKAAGVTTPATANISSDSYAGASVSVPAIVITEDALADIKVGSIMLTLPTGYIFDTTSIADITTTAVGLTSDAAVTFIGNTIMQFDITHVSTNDGTLTIGGVTPIKIKAAAGNPMASAGNITMSGTITGMDGSSNFGTLTQVPGVAHHLAVASQHGATEVAGTSYTNAITIKDVNNNTLDFDTDDQTCTFVVAGTPEGTPAANKPEYNNIDLVWNDGQSGWVGTDTNVDFENGVVTTAAFETFIAGAAKTISFTCNAISGTASVTVNPAAKDEVLISSTKPTIGYIFQNLSPQLSAKLVDVYGNTVTTDNASQITYKAYTSADCTTTAANPDLTGTATVAVTAGVATFPGLRYNTINTTGIYIRAAHDLGKGGAGIDDATEYDCTNLIKVYSNVAQTVTASPTTATTTTTAPTTTVTTAPATTTTTVATTAIPTPSKAISSMTVAEKNSYIMELQTFLIQLLTQLLTLMKK